MAAWLDLIPKIDKAVDGEQSNSAAHLLDQSDNKSTFDDAFRLIPTMDPFPFPPPMPPVRPNDSGWKQNFEEVTEDSSHILHGDQKLPSPGPKPSVDPGQGRSANLEETTAEPPKPYTYKAGTGVPLSIVVAIGGSLLLINVIIFAGLCYQRGRIRKMRLLSKPLPVPDMDIDEIRSNRNLESSRSSPCPMGGSGGAPECISLMSGASAHQHATSPLKQSQGNTHVHNPSPQPSLHSRRGQSQIRVTAPSSEPVICNYTAVPTQVTSPIHRTHIGVSQGGSPAAADRSDMNTYVNSKVRQPMDSNHKATESTSVLSTFSPGPRPGPAAPVPVTSPSVPNNQVVVTGTPGPPPPPPTSSTDDPLYKTINKTGQNNAVTIV